MQQKTCKCRINRKRSAAYALLAIEKGFLELSPVHVLTAQNGVDALEMVKEERPDLVVMDVNMPKMDGITCCASIKNDPSLRATPVIMVTNAFLKKDLEACLSAGCDDLIQKPVQGRMFLEKMHRFLPNIERREKRVSCRIEVSVRTSGDSIACVSCDISLHGMFVATTFEAEVGSDVALAFRVPTNGKYSTVVKGRVSWLNGGKALKKPVFPAGFGVEFLEITGEGMAALRAKELESFIASNSP